jgi:hypothetical protein
MTTGITKSEGSEDEAEPTDGKERDGDSCQGRPGPEETDDCTQTYNGGSHKGTVPQSHRFESSPSAGWREVYYRMGVDVR